MKVLIKLFVHLYVLVLVLFFSLLTKLVGFETVAIRISQIPYKLGNKVRYAFYKKHLKSLGENVIFSFGCLVTNVNTVIGNNVRFGPYNTVGLANLGDDIITASGLTLLGADDKAGVSCIMDFAHFMMNNPGFEHGKIRFTKC